ncbi:hypothetical protein STCU_05804 [Strigomonas culicis]|uniref:Uncharacterized protein n=1 Tax=Strigomonas culicis TaxID=28005 RepID=S9U985_9TRYP|nr:hypothetical protein STCU_05804 [Strigomonas culicis]|eukprot:EPY27332.1 hypothetical protein STCU_05804 [Strigomonas culicis]
MRSSCAFRIAALQGSRVCRCAAGGEQATAEDGGTLLHRMKMRDVSLVVPNADGTIRLTFIQNRHMLNETVHRHDLLNQFLPDLFATDSAAIARGLELVGTNLSFVNLLSAQLEQEERVEVRYAAGPFILLSESMALGETRCHLRAPADDAPAAARDERCLDTFLQWLRAEQGASGDMLRETLRLKVDKVLYNQNKKFVSLVKSNFASLLCTEDATAAAGAPVPLSLRLLPPLEALLPRQTLDPAVQHRLERLHDYYLHNMTLHAYNYFRSSDGVVAAVWCETLLRERDGRVADPADGSGVARESCGVLLTPLAAGGQAERDVYDVQRRLVQFAAAPPADSRDAAATSSPGHALLRLLNRDHEQQPGAGPNRYLTQEVLSFFTGDYEGAALAAEQARHFTNRDLRAVERRVEPLRRRVWGDALARPGAPRLSLNGAAARRCRLDFFCRCSKFDLLNSFITLPEEVFHQVMGEQLALHEGGSADEGIRCTYCGKRHVIAEKEWLQLKEYRDTHRTKA